MESDQLDEVQAILSEHVPEWSSGARLWRSRADQKSVDLRSTGALRSLLLDDEVRSNQLFASLPVEGGSTPRFPRFHGSLELRGADDTLTVLIRADEYILAPSAGRWLFANEVTFQLRRARIEEADAVTWAAAAFEALCERLALLHGDCRTLEEYDAKNISHAGGGLMAVGVDASRHLPGLYWLNYFGELYCELIGRKRLLTAPALDVRPVNSGLLLLLAENPHHWSRSEYAEREQAVLDHLGREFFFCREQPDRRTVAPQFLLPAGSPRPGRRATSVEETNDG